jgi:transcription elongation factor Elf1
VKPAAQPSALLRLPSVRLLRNSHNLRHNLRPGFIILFGSRAITSNDAAAPVQTRCPRCGQQSNLQPKSYRNWFTLFFVPVFPISGKTPFCECSVCGAQFQVPAEELRQRLADSDRQQNQQAIALYNSLRASPANSVTLNELMTAYASMNDFDSAISAAGEFPQALHASEQCMTTLGRVYLARNQFNEALQWFDAAVARNPSLGEAQYYKAVAHLLTTPPDPQKAVAAARAARGAGFANAEALLREAEEKARQG